MEAASHGTPHFHLVSSSSLLLHFVPLGHGGRQRSGQGREGGSKREGGRQRRVDQTMSGGGERERGVEERKRVRTDGQTHWEGGGGGRGAR